MPFAGQNVLQITSAAPGWRAIFADENEQGLVIETELAGWAVIENPAGERRVVGFDATGEVESCEALENFLGYAPPGVTASRWHREAVNYFGERKQTPFPAPTNGPLEVVRRQHTAIQRNDWAALRETYSPNASYRDPDVEINGVDGIVSRAQTLEAPFTDVRFEILDALVTDRRVVVSWRYQATNHARLTLLDDAVPATGRAVDIAGISLFDVADGLIVSETGYWDNQRLFGQLGLLSDPALSGRW